MRGNNKSAQADYSVHSREKQTSKTKLSSIHFKESSQSNPVGAALELFYARAKSIKRSTGGVINAEPYQIIFYDHNGSDTSKSNPKSRIKVRFKDMKFTETGKLLTPEPVLHTKIVLPGDLGEPFSYDLNNPSFQSFGMDFGKGIIPIYVVEYQNDPSGKCWAYFIETSALGELLQHKQGSRRTVRIYRVERDIIRYADTTRCIGQKSEYDLANQNYHALKAAGFQVIPEALAFKEPGQIPTKHTPSEIRSYLSAWIDNRTGTKNQKSKTENTPKEYTIDENDMMPFGVLEP